MADIITCWDETLCITLTEYKCNRVAETVTAYLMWRLPSSLAPYVPPIDLSNAVQCTADILSSYSPSSPPLFTADGRVSSVFVRDTCCVCLSIVPCSVRLPVCLSVTQDVPIYLKRPVCSSALPRSVTPLVAALTSKAPSKLKDTKIATFLGTRPQIDWCGSTKDRHVRRRSVCHPGRSLRQRYRRMMVKMYLT